MNKELGNIIEEQLYLYEMPTVELSVRLEMTQEETKELMNGKLEVTPNVAHKLENIFNAPARFWLSFNQTKEMTYA